MYLYIIFFFIKAYIMIYDLSYSRSSVQFSGSDAYVLMYFLVLIYQTSQQVNLQIKINRKQRKG
jgi:hypothetical protein